MDRKVGLLVVQEQTDEAKQFIFPKQLENYRTSCRLTVSSRTLRLLDTSSDKGVEQVDVFFFLSRFELSSVSEFYSNFSEMNSNFSIILFSNSPSGEIL